MKTDNIIKWSPDGLGWICSHCGTPNPDRGDKCGNCDENPFVLPPDDAQLTADELLNLKAATRHRA